MATIRNVLSDGCGEGVGEDRPVKKEFERISKCKLVDPEGVKKSAQQHFRRESAMTRNSLWRLAVFTACTIFSKSVAHAAAGVAGTDPELLSGDRMLQGTLEEVRDDQGRDDMGKGQSRFIPVGVRKDKGLLELKNGDPAEITVIDQNLPGDEHLPSEVRHHRVVVGQLAGPMETGHDNVVIRIADGNEVSYLVRPSARSKVASMPVGVDVIFLIDEFHKIVAIARGSVESAHRAAEVGRQKSPLKSNLQHPRTADLETGKDLAGVDVCRRLGIMEQPYDRWKKEYGELRVDHTKRLKALEQENLRLKRMVADQALDLAILKEVAEDKF
jgi:hypothetical protein